EQWCRDAKSLMTTDAGVASDSTRCFLGPSNDGHRTSDLDAGSPLAAKLDQAARMLAASTSWSGLSGVWNGAVGRSKRYPSSYVCVATGGSTGGIARAGALSSSNS